MIQVSTIIPARNSASTIARALSAVLCQIYKSKEVIVVDDGPSDNTGKNVASFSEVNYVYQENAGVSTARNKGAELATSEWLAFCDSDDIWDPLKLEVFSTYIDRNPEAVFVFSDFFIFDSSGVICGRGMSRESTVFPIFREHRISMKKVFQPFRSVEIRIPTERWVTTRVFSGNAFQALIL